MAEEKKEQKEETKQLQSEETPPSSTPTLNESIQEAQLLLHYASQHGIQVNNEHVKVLVNAKRTVGTAAFTADLEVEFWEAYSSLAKLLEPISVSSIKAIEEIIIPEKKVYGIQVRKPRSKAQRVSRNYRYGVLIFLFLMLLVQGYWVIGKELVAEFSKIEMAHKALDNKILEKPGDLTLIEEMKENQALLEANYDLLCKWNMGWKVFPKIFHTVLSPIVDVKKVIRDDDGSQDKEKVQNGPRHDPEVSQHISIKTASFALEVINAYVLPFLYGILGAFAFVLRELALEVKTLTFTRVSVINYRLRLQLGALAGLAIGWFIGDSNGAETGFAIASLSPLALAFVAGYSVELLFSAMDRFIKTFTDKKENKSSPPPECKYAPPQ